MVWRFAGSKTIAHDNQRYARGNGIKETAMTVRPILWLLWLMVICCLLHNAECRRYDRCSTREGRSGICVAKRFCREAATTSRQILTACPDSSGFYCCPVPTTRSSAGEPSSPKSAATPPPKRLSPPTVEPPPRRSDDRFQTPETRYTPDTEFGRPSHSSSSVSQEGTYRNPEGDERPAGPTREKKPGNHESGSGRFHGGVRYEDEERPPSKRPRYEEQDRRHVPNVTTKPSAPVRPTSSPSRGYNRSPVVKHTLPPAPIRIPEEYKPQRPSAPACGQKPYELFIAGGEESKQHEWPWMVAIFRRHSSPKPSTYICGGSLINNRYILSAAHCFVHNYVILPASTFIVRLGAHYLDSGEDYTVANLILHQNHSGSEFFNDIALLRLASEVFFTDKIAPICLPSHEMSSKTFVDRIATVSGWGSTAFYRTADSRVLQHVNVPVLSNEECSSAYSRVRGAAFLARGSGHIICAGLREGGKDACLGDSGGPLMLKTKGDFWTVIGIVSLGYKCAEPGYPGVYTRVTHYLSWIYSNMKDF